MNAGDLDQRWLAAGEGREPFHRVGVRASASMVATGDATTRFRRRSCALLMRRVGGDPMLELVRITIDLTRAGLLLIDAVLLEVEACLP